MDLGINCSYEHLHKECGIHDNSIVKKTTTIDWFQIILFAKQLLNFNMQMMLSSLNC